VAGGITVSLLMEKFLSSEKSNGYPRLKVGAAFSGSQPKVSEGSAGP